MPLRPWGLKPIFALTPQAKGRVERLFKTLQDRLIAEMALNHRGCKSLFGYGLYKRFQQTVCGLA